MALGVTVDFTASLVKFSGQMDTMAGKLDQFQKRAETMSSRVNSAFSALGVGLSAAGLVSFVKNGIDAADALNDLADRSGIAIEKLAGLEYAVKLGDTSMEAFVAASNKLSINVAKNAESFAALGVSAQDPVEQFKQFADVFAAIDDPQQRAAVGAAALGKAYAEMAPLLLRGSAGIQELIDKGREHNPITAEQAQLAGEFNDKLDTLTNRMQGFSIVVAGPVVDSLNDFGNAISFAMEQADGFNPLQFMTDYANGSNKADQLGRLNQQINETTAALGKMESQGIGGQMVDMLLGNNYEETYAKLQKLTSARDKLTSPPPSAASQVNESQKAAALALAKAVGDEEEGHKKAAGAVKTHASALNSAAKEQSRHAELIAKTVESLKFEISLTGQSVDAQRLLSDIRSATADATAEEAAAIEKLIKTKYDMIEADNILADGEKLAQQQRADSAADNERLRQMFSGENQSMYSQFDDAFKAKGAGIINDQELAKALENISQGLDAVTGKGKDTTDQLSVYAEQAGRNMQDAFADFLFDPFDKGMDGMLDGFLTTIRRMAANVASTQLMEGLFGKSGSKDGGGLFGPLLGAVSSGLSGMFGGGLNADINGLIGNSALFADGGIMTSVGPVPLRKYASGGVASSPQLAMFGEGSKPEAYVPLPDGRRIPVAMENGSGKQVVNNITLNISTPNADSFRKSERQIRDQMLRAVNV